MTSISPAHLYHPVRIGSVEVPGNLFLAPLAGFTDRSFREICIREGADLTYSEMVSAEAVARGNTKTEMLMRRAPSEKLFAIQLFMKDEDTARRAAAGVMRFSPSIIDINSGCPVPKVVKTGAGSALHKDPRELGRIVLALREETGVPVTIKIRLGWDVPDINYLQMAEEAVNAGAALITMHARTRSQGYSGTAAWEHLARLKEAVPVPVFGSGDLYTAEDGRRMLEQTGIDGLMFARGAVGNPLIFSQTRTLLTGGSLPAETDWDAKLLRLRDHLQLAVEDKGEAAACREMRKQACSYTKGMPHAAALRAEFIHAQTLEDYLKILHLDQYYSE